MGDDLGHPDLTEEVRLLHGEAMHALSAGHDAAQASAQGRARLPSTHEEDAELVHREPIRSELEGVRVGAREAPCVDEVSACSDHAVVTVVSATSRRVVVATRAPHAMAVWRADLGGGGREGGAEERCEGEEELHRRSGGCWR